MLKFDAFNSYIFYSTGLSSIYSNPMSFSFSFLKLQPVAKMLRHSDEKRPFLVQIAASHRSVRHNDDLPTPSHSRFFLDRRGDHKHKIMDRLFKPKYSTVSQVLLQLFVACFPVMVFMTVLQVGYVFT